MDLEVLRKKISTYKTEGGRLNKVSDDLTMEILHFWEQWTGPASGFYSAIDVDQRKLASIIGRGKKLKRDGYLPSENFKEIKLLESPQIASLPVSGGAAMELVLDRGQIIRFYQVELLIEFLKKSA